MPRSKKTPQQTATFKKLKKFVQQSGPWDLLTFHRAGEQVFKLCPSERQETRRYGNYGDAEIQNLAEKLGKPKSFAVKLWNARYFYQEFQSRDIPRSEVKKLSKPDAKTGYRLTWAHMQSLLSIDNEKKRLNFQQRCTKGEWSSRKLRSEIKQSRGRQGQGGRKFKKPRTVKDALLQLISESKGWNQRYHEVWFPADKPAIPVGRPYPKSQVVSGLADEAIKILEALQEDIEDCLPKLRTLRTKARRKK